MNIRKRGILMFGGHCVPSLSLCRCCPASFRSRGWCSSPPTGPGSLWWQRVCCCSCRSVEEEIVFLFFFTLKRCCITSRIVPLSIYLLNRSSVPLTSPSASVLAAALCSRVGERNAGLPHGSHGLPDGLSHQ